MVHQKLDIIDRALLEAREEGLEKGNRKWLIDLLTMKFGNLSEETLGRIRELSVEQLDNAFHIAIEADQLDDVPL